MKEDIEFQEIGKRTPYQVPEGFFEHIPGKTLQKVKLREQNHRNHWILWKTMAVAASLAAVVMIGFLISGPEKTENKMIVQEQQVESELAIESAPDSLKELMVPIVKKDSVAKMNHESAVQEDITDILSDLSDEELLQLAAIYKADPFIEVDMQ